MNPPSAQFTLRAIEDLKNADPVLASHVRVLGYLKPGDGGGGDFQWEQGSTEPQDFGLIFESTSALNNGRWKRIGAGDINVRWFGAQGDWQENKPAQGTDDYEALLHAAARLTAMGKGTLYFPPGTYRIGRYKDGTKTGPNVANDIIFRNCDGLHIKGYGAKVDVNGDFGRTPTNMLSAVEPLVFLGCRNVTIEGLELDGNVDDTTRVAGVTQGGSGIIFGGGSSQYTLTDLYVHHFANDGIYLGMSSPPFSNAAQKIADKNATLRNVRSKFNARNALSIISLNGGTFDNCEFAESGHSCGAYGFDSPGAGVDIEPQFGLKSTDLVFSDCKFVNNSGSGIDISSGPVSFQRCLFWGTEGYSIIIASNVVLNPDKTYSISDVTDARDVTFEDCEIFGECLSDFADPTAMPKFRCCHFEDKEFPANGKVFRTAPPYGACVVTNLGNIQLEACLVVGNRTRALHLPQPVRIANSSAIYQHALSNSSVIHRFSGLPVKIGNTSYDHQSMLIEVAVSNVRFMEDMYPPIPPPTPPAPVPPPNQKSIWFIAVPPHPQIAAPVYVDGPYVRWAQPKVMTPQVIA
ncbi:MAG: right-handed parallel beta-helix repeat-containing protein [Candidatus Acidiferrum sp.]